MNAKWIGSRHKRRGRKGYKPDAVVVHIMEGTLRGTDAWFNDLRSKVSAHYGVGKNGEVHQYVHEADTAWHAGRKTSDATWKLLRRTPNPNYYTIGIEHEGKADEPWTDAMYRASAYLIRDICTRWSIPMDRDHIVGHREIYPRKTCPGDGVDLERLVRLVREEAVAISAVIYNFVNDPQEVVTRVSLNVRKAPTVEAERVRTEDSDATFKVLGWTSNGQSVSGNAHWYRLDGNLYVWAGGTRAPVPGLEHTGVVERAA